MKVEKSDEIGLYEILNVFWKWKWFIIGSVAVAAISMAVFLSFQKNYYRATMTIEPVSLRHNKDGTNEYIESAANIQNVIESGILNKGIKEKAGESGVGKNELIFKVRVKKPTVRIEVSMVHSSSDRAGKIMTWLVQALNDYYQEKIQRYRESKINQIRAVEEQVVVIGMDENELANTHKFQLVKEIEKQSFDRVECKELEERLEKLELKILKTGNKLKVIRQGHDSAIKAGGQTTGNNEYVLSGLRLDFTDRFLFELEIGKDVVTKELERCNLNIKQRKEKIKEINYNFNDRKMRLKLKEEHFKKKIELIKQQAVFKHKDDDIIIISERPETSSSPVKPKRSILMFLAFISGMLISIPCVFVFEHIQIQKKKNLVEHG